MKCIIPLLLITLGAATAMAVGLNSPSVTGAPGGGDTYTVSFTQEPMDPMVKDFHLYWQPTTTPHPNQSKWANNLPAGWVCNTGYAPNPNGSGSVNYVSYTNPNGVYTASWENAQTFIFSRSGYNPPYPNITYEYLITKDGDEDLPPDLDDAGNVLNSGTMSMSGTTGPPSN